MSTSALSHLPRFYFKESDKTSRCSGCKETIESGDLIFGHDRRNQNGHWFHTKCTQDVFQHLQSHDECKPCGYQVRYTQIKYAQIRKEDEDDDEDLKGWNNIQSDQVDLGKTSFIIGKVVKKFLNCSDCQKPIEANSLVMGHMNDQGGHWFHLEHHPDIVPKIAQSKACPIPKCKEPLHFKHTADPSPENLDVKTPYPPTSLNDRPHPDGDLQLEDPDAPPADCAEGFHDIRTGKDTTLNPQDDYDSCCPTCGALGVCCCIALLANGYCSVQ